VREREQMKSMAFFHVYIYTYTSVREKDIIEDIKSGLPFFFACYFVYTISMYGVKIKREKKRRKMNVMI
jgi:hypothetical protein